MALGALPDSLEEWFKAHNFSDGNKREVRRVYFYSEGDTMIDWRDVKMHAEVARVRGFEVALEKFEDSEHVAHARRDGERYWGIVRRTFEG